MQTFGSWKAAEQYWLSIGWHPLDDLVQMDAIADAWKANFGCEYGIWGAGAVIPPPARTWDINPLSLLAELGSDIAADFHTRMLAAFRHCVPRGERLLAIGHWQHSWYEFDPHGSLDPSTHTDWAEPILPHDASHFISRDFRLGTYGDYRGALTIFGQELLAALEMDPPNEFLRVCRAVPRADGE